MNNTTQTHPEDLLAFYVNGSLTGQERADVESHVQHCEYCQQQVALLRLMRDSMQQTSVDGFPEEFAWQRLKRDMQQQPVTQAHQKPGWWRQGIAVAAAVVIAVQAGLIVSLNQDVESYTQAGYKQPGTILQIKVNPAASEAQFRELLLGINAELVAGPSATGLYRIRLPQKSTEQDVDSSLNKLASSRDIILFVARE